MESVFNEKTGSVYELIGTAHEFKVGFRLWLAPNAKIPGSTTIKFRLRLIPDFNMLMQSGLGEKGLPFALKIRFPKMKFDKVTSTYASVAGSSVVAVSLVDAEFGEYLSKSGFFAGLLLTITEGIRGFQTPHGNDLANWSDFMFKYLEKLLDFEAPKVWKQPFDLELGPLMVSYNNGKLVGSNFDELGAKPVPMVPCPANTPAEQLAATGMLLPKMTKEDAEAKKAKEAYLMVQSIKGLSELAQYINTSSLEPTEKAETMNYVQQLILTSKTVDTEDIKVKMLAKIKSFPQKDHHPNVVDKSITINIPAGSWKFLEGAGDIEIPELKSPIDLSDGQKPKGPTLDL